jgi:lipid II:glycine glycyltransferase (peptidoglycan interpeptide bridge formation enzyme)
MIRFTLASVDGISVAASVDLLYKDNIYGWYGGMDRNYRRYNPNEIVMWNILAWGAANNYSVYDFGGAGHPDKQSGIRDFKSKFGGEPVNFGRFVRIHSRLRLNVSKVFYSLLRRFL